MKEVVQGNEAVCFTGIDVTFSTRSCLKQGYFRRRIFVENQKLTEPFLLYDSFSSEKFWFSFSFLFFFSFPSLMIFLYDIF